MANSEDSEPFQGVSKTPAGARLEHWWRKSHFRLSPYGQDPPFDAMAAIVLNVSEIDSSEPIKAFAEVMKGEFPLIQAPDELWERSAAGITAKLEGLGIFLLHSIQPHEEERST